LPAVSAPSIAGAAVPLSGLSSVCSNAVAFVAAVARAAVAAFFSVTGMVEVFPGAPIAVMVPAGTMEAGKLVIVGWLAAHWFVAGWKLRTVLVALVIVRSQQYDDPLWTEMSQNSASGPATALSIRCAT
jgi:hypothetical protein